MSNKKKKLVIIKFKDYNVQIEKDDRKFNYVYKKRKWYLSTRGKIKYDVSFKKSIFCHVD